MQTCGIPLTAVLLLPMVHREHVGLGPYQLSTPVQGEKVEDNPGTDLPHLCASQEPEQTK